MVFNLFDNGDDFSNIHYIRIDDFSIVTLDCLMTMEMSYLQINIRIPLIDKLTKFIPWFYDNPTKNKDLKFYDCFNHINNSLYIEDKAQSIAEQSESLDCPCGVLCFKNNFFYNFLECKQKLELPKPTMPYEYIGNNTQLPSVCQNM